MSLNIRQLFHRGNKAATYEKTLRESIPYDPAMQEAVIRVSICTGEKIAGFRNKETHHFTEAMLIQSPDDLERFKNIYDLSSVKEIY